MQKKNRKKLTLNRNSIRQLDGAQLSRAAGGAYTDAADCVETVPLSFCLCPTKNVCSLGC